MSNCIHFNGTGLLTFRADEIDIPRLRDFLNSLKKYTKSPDDMRDYVGWWFLEKNTTILDDSVEIDLGGGRSSHTWRDFNNLKILLQKEFILKHVEFRLSISDECDGFTNVEDAVLVLDNKRSE